jgi:hypothetical protein
MRILPGILVVALGMSAACANRSNTPAQGGTATGAAAPAGGTQTAGAPAGARGGGPGAQAAARMPPDALDPIMKKVGPTNAEMRKKLMGNMVADARSDALALAELFGEVERFWAQNNRPDAVKWAQQARANASEAAGAAAAGDGTKAQASADNMLAACKQCHGMYREGDQQTGFRIKPGVATE